MTLSPEHLDQLLNHHNDLDTLYTIFDQLPAVAEDFMIGTWTGAEIPTDSPLQGLLPASGWYGKRFDSSEAVFPLLFKNKRGVIYAGNPGRILFSNKLFSLNRKIVELVFPLMHPFIKTQKSFARLRQIAHRGVSTTAMIYDQLAIIDVFRKIDDNTVMGLMDFKDEQGPSSEFFVLYRVS